LAKRHGISPTTVQKWRKRTFTAGVARGGLMTAVHFVAWIDGAAIDGSEGAALDRTQP
jgi:hypothetical protein